MGLGSHIERVDGFTWPVSPSSPPPKQGKVFFNPTMVKDQIIPEPGAKPTESQLAAIPPITPDHPNIVNPTGEFGPESYIDTGAYSPAKYPIDYKKRKTPKKVDEGKKKKARKNLTLELPKQQGTLDKWLKRKRLRFSNIVWLNHCVILPLTGYSLPQSQFYLKRVEQKQRMKQRHLNRLMTPRRLNIQRHMRETLAKH